MEPDAGRRGGGRGRRHGAARGVRRRRPRDRSAPTPAPGVEYISVGAITHSAAALDIALDIAPRSRGDLTAMLLAIDTGNTQTVIGLFDGAELADHWRIATVASRTSDELALMIQQFLGLPRLLLRRPGHRRRGLLRRAQRDRGAPRDDRRATSDSRRWCSSPASAPGCRSSTTTRRRSVPTASPTPSAAFELYGGPTIVVDFGTANTVEAISAKGEYLGGAIFPGVEISMDALFGRAAALRRVELVPPRNVIGKSTVESIQSGVIYGFSGQIDAIVRPLRRASSARAPSSRPAGSPSRSCRSPARSSTTSRGSRCTACGSSSSATSALTHRPRSATARDGRWRPSGILDGSHGGSACASWSREWAARSALASRSCSRSAVTSPRSSASTSCRPAAASGAASSAASIRATATSSPRSRRRSPGRGRALRDLRARFPPPAEDGGALHPGRGRRPRSGARPGPASSTRIVLRSGISVYGRGRGRPERARRGGAGRADHDRSAGACSRSRRSPSTSGASHDVPVDRAADGDDRGFAHAEPARPGAAAARGAGARARRPGLPAAPRRRRGPGDGGRPCSSSVDGPLNVVGPGAASVWQAVRLGGRVPVPIAGPMWSRRRPGGGARRRAGARRT